MITVQMLDNDKSFNRVAAGDRTDGSGLGLGQEEGAPERAAWYMVGGNAELLLFQALFRNGTLSSSRRSLINFLRS